MSVAVMPGCGLPVQFHADDLRQPHPRGAPEHDVLRFETADADRDHAERIDVRRVGCRCRRRCRETRRRPAHG